MSETGRGMIHGFPWPQWHCLCSVTPQHRAHTNKCAVTCLRAFGPRPLATPGIRWHNSAPSYRRTTEVGSERILFCTTMSYGTAERMRYLPP